MLKIITKSDFNRRLGYKVHPYCGYNKNVTRYYENFTKIFHRFNLLLSKGKVEVDVHFLDRLSERYSGLRLPSPKVMIKLINDPKLQFKFDTHRKDKECSVVRGHGFKILVKIQGDTVRLKTIYGENHETSEIIKRYFLPISNSVTRNSVFYLMKNIEHSKGWELSKGRLRLHGNVILQLGAIGLLKEVFEGYPKIKKAIEHKNYYYDKASDGMTLREVLKSIAPRTLLQSYCDCYGFGDVLRFSGSSIFMFSKNVFEVFNSDGMVRYNAKQTVVNVKGSSNNFLKTLYNAIQDRMDYSLRNSYPKNQYLITETPLGCLVQHGKSHGTFIHNISKIGKTELEKVLMMSPEEDKSIVIPRYLSSRLGKRKGLAYRDFSNGFDYYLDEGVSTVYYKGHLVE